MCFYDVAARARRASTASTVLDTPRHNQPRAQVKFTDKERVHDYVEAEPVAVPGGQVLTLLSFTDRLVISFLRT